MSRHLLEDALLLRSKSNQNSLKIMKKKVKNIAQKILKERRKTSSQRKSSPPPSEKIISVNNI